MASSRSMIPHEFIDAPLRGIESLGFNRRDIWLRAGLDPQALQQPQLNISNDDYARLLFTIWHACDDEFMGLAPVRSHFGTFSMMCKAIIQLLLTGTRAAPRPGLLCLIRRRAEHPAGKRQTTEQNHHRTPAGIRSALFPW